MKGKISLLLILSLGLTLIIIGCGEVVETEHQPEPTGDVKLTWTAPTTNTDNSPLKNLVGYKIYYGRNSDVSDYVVDINNLATTEIIIWDLTQRRWYFAITAYNIFTHESDMSSVIDTIVYPSAAVTPEIFL